MEPVAKHRLVLGWLAALALLATGPGRAADTPASTPPRQDEAGLLRDADDIEKRLSVSGQFYGTVALDVYVQSIADALRGPDDPQPLRVRVLRSPWPNAFVLPNGAAYVTTAMLDMLDNEAQLACVLGHEMTHLTAHHALLEMRAQHVRENWATVLAVIVGSVGAYYGGSQAGSALVNLTASAGELWTLSAVSGYSRDNEREADRQGFARLAATGYDTTEAPKVFEALRARTPDAGQATRPYFASHPKLDERIASFQALVAAQGTAAGGKLDADRFLAAVGDLPLDQARLLLGAREPAEAQRGLERYLVRHPDSAQAHYLAGEAWRNQPTAADRVDRALAEYARAAALPAPPPDALRQLGLLYRERGDDAAARAAFERLLVLDPQAVDAGLVRLYLQEMEAPPRP